MTAVCTCLCVCVFVLWWWNFFFFFFLPFCAILFFSSSTPSSLFGLFSTLVVEWCTWRAQVTALTCSHLCIRCHYVFSHSYCPWVEYFLCLCEVLCQFLNVLSLNTTPRWLRWVGAGGRWTCAACRLSSCQQMVNTGTLTISLLSEAWLLSMSRRQLEGWTRPVLSFSSTGGS